MMLLVSEYINVFIFYLIVGVLITILGFTLISMAIRDFKIKKYIAEGNIAHMYTMEKPKKLKKKWFYFKVLILVGALIFYNISMQIPIYRDIPLLMKKDFQKVEGMVNQIDYNRGYRSVHIGDIQVIDGTLAAIKIEPYKRYRITYMKHSLFIINVDMIN